jgi:hypothetical protein
MGMKHLGVSIGRAAMVAVLAAGIPSTALAQSKAPASASVVKAKELAALMKSRKLDSFAVREGTSPNRFVAVMVVPDVQMLLVSAAYSRASDIEYRIYQKDYATAYRDLRTGALASDKFFVEDAFGDGLVPVPLKNRPPDSVMMGGTDQVFEGPADPRKRNDKRMPAEAYSKAFGEADQRYAQLLDSILAELKKGALLEPSRVLR